jgi:dTDP-4-amino-4,6-dideoxygalactose transaminase
VTVPLLDLHAQYAPLRKDILAAVTRVCDSQRFIGGPEVDLLERELCESLNVPHAIGLSSGTDAVLAALMALDIGPGDEVITPTYSFFATAGCVVRAGATPVLVDIEPATFNLDVGATLDAITPRTRAIIPVHLFGQMADMVGLLKLGRSRGIPIIEDACQAIGARRRIDGEWRAAGELGWVTAYSFFPSKNLGAWGDGGMMVTSDEVTAGRLRRLRLHGGAKQYHHDEVGTNSRLDTLQAAVLLAKLPHLAGWSAKRREHAAYYSAAFAGLKQVRPLAVDPDNEHIFHQYTLRAEQRDDLQAHLKKEGIGHAVYYPVPLHRQPCFAHLGYQQGSMPVSERAAAEVISLPIFPELTRAQLDRVIDAIRGFYR